MTTTTRALVARCLLILIACASGLALTAFTHAAAVQAAEEAIPAQAADIEVFVRDGCPHCARAKTFLAALQQEQPRLKIVVRDVVREPESRKRLRRLAEKHGLAAVSVPTFVVGGQVIVGFADEANTGQTIRDSLAGARTTRSDEPRPLSQSCEAAQNLRCEASAAAGSGETFAISFLGRQLTLDQVGLPLFTVAMGLLDGFNPCSMWVLILMLSLLAPMKNRRRMLAIAGTFVAMQGIAYYLFMAAWLNFFLLVGISRLSQIIIAVLAIIAGAINLKDFWRPRWGASLSIPSAAKPGVYARMRRILQAENLTGAIVGAVMLAVFVQIVEFVCTSGFPALFTRILTLQPLSRPAYYGYLMLYDLVYMLDDAVILAIGVLTLSQRRLQERAGRWLKFVSGAVMVGLGVFLLLSPN